MAQKRSLSVLGQSKITIAGRTFSYAVKRSPRARFARIEFRPQTGIAVVIPRGFDTSEIPRLLKDKSKWLLDKLARLAQAKPITPLKSGDKIPYLGRELELVVRLNQDCYYAQLAMDRLIVGMKCGEKGDVAGVLRQWYRWQCSHLLKEKAAELSHKLGISYQRIVVKGQKTLWGSCSHRGTLSFNWKLLMVPEPVIDYVIIHELNHFREMNHSRRFWKLVEESCPDWRKHRRWLRDHETQLGAGIIA